uniref:NADH dehydrogenase subunit 4L n=1 Tax=Cacopsylla melanoneura TaxID=428564 RepID=A0A8D8PN16_9HEMI
MKLLCLVGLLFLTRLLSAAAAISLFVTLESAVKATAVMFWSFTCKPSALVGFFLILVGDIAIVIGFSISGLVFLLLGIPVRRSTDSIPFLIFRIFFKSNDLKLLLSDVVDLLPFFSTETLFSPAERLFSYL